MNKQIGVGIFIAILVGIFVAVPLFQQSASDVAQMTTTSSFTNKSYTAPAAGSTIDLLGQEILTTPMVQNVTSGAEVSTTNYTIAETVSSVDGLKRISYTSKTGAKYAGQTVNISYTYGPEGYADDAGARSVTSLIILLAALSIGVFVIVMVFPSIRETIGMD